MKTFIPATTTDHVPAASANDVVYYVEENAQITIVQQYEASDTPQRITIRTEKNSTVHFYCCITGSVSLDIILELQGQGSSVVVHGVYVLDATHVATVTTRQQHTTAHTTSAVTLKGVLAGSARMYYHGTIYVDKDACNTVAQQHNKTIVLSDQAQSRSIPSLEVLNNEVHCAHGSAVGQLDPEQMWYMQSRGIAYYDAQQLLLKGFLSVDDNHIRKVVDATINHITKK